MDTPGINGQIFTVKFDSEWHSSRNLVDVDSRETVTVKVISDIKHIHYQWGWKVLNFITFGKFFKEGYIYGVKLNPAQYDCPICRDIGCTNDGFPCYYCKFEEFTKQIKD